MRIGSLPVTKGLAILTPIAKEHGLNLHRAKQLRLARLLYIVRMKNRI